jgi:CheY-like chemotaxis protein
VLLPLREPDLDDQQAKPTRANSRQLPLKDVSVLLVDDEQDSRELMSELLELFGASTSNAASVQQALNNIVSNRPQVLVSDIAMPAMDGYDLIRRVREIVPAEVMPAIALTGLSRSGEQERAIEAGFQRYVVKPVSPAALVEVILSLVERNASNPT